jgi:hypothetical protein
MPTHQQIRMTSRITGDLPDDGEAVTAVRVRRLKAMRAQRNLIATPRPRFSFQGCQQVGSEEPAAVALMNP